MGEVGNPRADLRDALARSRAVAVIDELNKRQIAFKYRVDAAEVLQNMFFEIHRKLYQDWEAQQLGNNTAQTSALIAEGTPDKKRAIREAFVWLTKDSGLLDANGAFTHLSEDKVAGVLGTFYRKIQEIDRFPYGNQLTLDAFMVALGNFLAFRERYPNGLDFAHRLTETEDLQTLHNKRSDNDLVAVFKKTLQPTIAKAEEGQMHQPFSEAVEYVSGIRFLGHQEGDNHYLVTINGGLVELDDKLRKELEEKLAQTPEHIEHLPKFHAEKFLPNTEHLRVKDVANIDGIPLGEDGKAPLFCLETNIFTGLREQGQNTLEQFVEQNAPLGTKLFDLVKPENAGLLQELQDRAKNTENIQPILAIALPRLRLMKEKLERDAAEELSKATAVANSDTPQFFMNFGGAASGKGSVETIAKHVTRNNVVMASLDEFRKKSALYDVLIAAGEHACDYDYVTGYGDALRDEVMEGAKKSRKNILFDSSGIVYKGRYDKLVKNFKDANYETHLYGVDAMLFAPKGREAEFSDPLALQRLWTRSLGEDGRAMPYLIMKRKHTEAAQSFLDAKDDSNLDTACLLSTDVQGKNYLVAESFVIDAEQERALKRSLEYKSLHTYFLNDFLKGEKSALRTFAETYHKPIDECIRAIPTYNPENPASKKPEDNVAYLFSRKGGESRVTLIYDKQRYIDFVNKSLLNPYSQTEQGMNNIPMKAAFLINEKEPGKVDLGRWQNMVAANDGNFRCTGNARQ